MVADVMNRTAGGSLWVGVDLGTQSVKVTIVGDDGEVRAQSNSPLTSVRDGGRHEQDPTLWIAASRSALRAALASLGPHERQRVRGIAVCATSGTITFVDAAGRPTGVGIMYDDDRAAALIDDVLEADPALWLRLGYRAQPTWALTKIVWAAQNGHFGAGTFLAHQADVVAAAITGTRVATDWSHALKSGFDTIELSWPGLALSALDVDPHVLPDVVAPGTSLGSSSRQWSDGVGLPVGTPVFAGMTDGCAAQLGAAAFGLGDWHSVLGTTFVAKGVSGAAIGDDSGAVYSHRAPHDGLWLPGGASNVGAGILSKLLPGADLDALTREVASMAPSSIPLSYPLHGRGERFPVLRPDAEGFIVVDDREQPLSSAATALPPATLFAAILLGVALVERVSVETMARAGVAVNGRFSTSGGGTQNPWWTQLRADVLGRPVVVPASAEGSVGMAILAAWGAEGGRLPDVATRMSITSDTVEPDAARTDELDDVYSRFTALLGAKGWIPS